MTSPGVTSRPAGRAGTDPPAARRIANSMARWTSPQQVGGSIGTSALSTIALTATAGYLTAHHSGPLVPPIAATRGYTLAFAVSAALLGFGVILAVVLLPSRRRLRGEV